MEVVASVSRLYLNGRPRVMTTRRDPFGDGHETTETDEGLAEPGVVQKGKRSSKTAGIELPKSSPSLFVRRCDSWVPRTAVKGRFLLVRDCCSPLDTFTIVSP